MNAIRNFIRDEEGAVAIEYGLLAALIAVVIIAGAMAVGKNICGVLTSISKVLGSPTVAYTFAAC